jgi:N-acyl-D-aspartate/D-glutamate deacylase
MSLKAMELGIDWEFESFPEYLNHLESKGVGPNVGAFVGHSSVRTYVMGAEAAHRQATELEVESMREIVANALRVGAVGFATSTSPSHNGADGNPMPSRLADKEELRRLVGVLGEQKKGVFMLTKGAPTPVSFLESLAADTQRPVMIAALLHNSTDPEGVFNDLSQISDARNRNITLWGQVSCCPLSTEFTLKAPYPFEGLSAWQPAMRADSEDCYRKLLLDPSFRSNIRSELTQPAAVRLFNGEWEKLKVLEVIHDKNRRFEGKSILEITNKTGEDPLDFLLNLSLEEDLGTTFLSVLLNSDEDAVRRLLTHPFSSIALSDAGAHLTFFCDAGFGLHLLGYWIRERQIMSLEEGIHRLTGQPAQIYGIPDRGHIRPGAYADLFLFDPKTVGRSQARRIYDLPGGERRLTTDPQGVHGVWINGTQVSSETGDMEIDRYPGQVLRKFDS